MSDFYNKLWTNTILKYWYVRGFFAAIAISETVPSFIDIERYDFLRAFHSIIVGWQKIIGSISDLFQSVKFLPDLSPAAVSTVIFFLTYSAPLSLFTFQACKSLVTEMMEDETEYPISTILSFWWIIPIFLSLSPFLIVYVHYLFVSNSIFFDPRLFPLSIFRYENGHSELPSLVLVTLISYVYVGVVFSVFRYSSNFRNGFLFFFGICISLEIFYYLQSPALGEAIRGWTCILIDDSYNSCN